MAAPLVSVVVPAFNESARLPSMLSDLAQALAQTRSPRVELWVVDDGSAPSQVEAEQAAAAQAAAQLKAHGEAHRIHFHQLPRNQGKGAAIRAGWERASEQAQWLGFLDADGAVPPGEFVRLAKMLEAADFDVLAGSRVLMAGRSVVRRPLRHIQGRIFATLTESMLGLGFYDTQCGVKFFRAALLRPHLKALAEDRWMLDVELLTLMRTLGAAAREVPIDWSDVGQSKVRVARDAWKMLGGLWRIRRRLGS